MIYTGIYQSSGSVTVKKAGVRGKRPARKPRVVRETVVAPFEAAADTAKLFWNGRSQAVRLPKQFRFEGEAVYIRRSGDVVILEPMRNERGWPPGFWEGLGRLGPDFERAVLENRGKGESGAPDFDAS